MRAGDMDTRARFEVSVTVPDGGGGTETTWQHFITVWAQFSPERARERIQAGRLTSSFAGVLRIRSSSQSREITTRHRVVVGGVTYNIRSVANPDQRNDMLEFGIETDGA